MKPPARIEPWMSPEELGVWVREATTKDAYQKRLVVWLTAVHSLHAGKVGDLLQVSQQAVWLWVKQYNQRGPEGLERKGRGGRRWGFLSWAEEEALLQSLEGPARRGEILTAKQLKPRIEEALGREVGLPYLYRLLRRHQWRKVGPRPRHVKADREAQEAFKKTFPESSAKP